MRREYIQSTSIKSIGYDPARLVLEVEFLTGTVYQYSNVPESVYAGFITAESKGRYFDYFIRERFAIKKNR
ncbi:MAG: KTSC domain-containing protein [Bacteroidia bacterium]